MTKTSIFEYNDTGIQKTPISIIKLVDQLLEIKDNDSLLDVCSGIGVTLAYLSMDKDVKLMGIEINEQTYIHSKLLLNVIHKNTTKIIFADALKTDLTPFNANKVFINGPIGFKFPKDKYEDIFEKKFSRTNYEKLIPKHDSSWIFVLDAILHSNFEKIVVVMNEASLVNNREIMIRKQLIEDGYIEAVIDLPEGLLDYSNIPVSLLILSKNNKNVKFVDATKLGSKKIRQTILHDDDIETIINALENETEKSKTCEYDELANEDFIFSSKRYLIPDLPYEKTVQLKDVVKSIHRGAMISTKYLEELKSDEPTQFQYLSLNNVNNGIVETDLPFITDIDESLERHVITKDSLIISKMAPFKVAFIELNDRKILMSSNLYFLEIDETKINPKYMEAYLQSQLGIREFKKYEKGSAMKTISISDLEKIKIPILSEEEQQKIGNKYELLKREHLVNLENIRRIEDEKKKIMEG